MQKEMLQNLTAMTASQLKRDNKDDARKSMFSRLSPEAGKLFDLLAARDWRDERPKMSSAIRNLVSDKDSQRALGIIRTLTKKWPGTVSEKGLLGFFANGFAANNIQESPGGFTIFSFRPITADDRSKDKKGKEQQLRSMFGNIELDDEAVKYYAANDFYIPNSLEALEEQLFTCIQCLEWFTEKHGIATVGFEHGLRMLQQRKRVFIHLFGMDPLFPVKFAYLLDRVFQNFVDELGNYYASENPIRRAAKRLKDYQVNAIENAMMGYDTSCAPRLFLPSSLQGTTEPNTEKEKPERSEKEKEKAKGASKQEDWWSSNPNVVPSWHIPEGKSYNHYFDPNIAARRDKAKGWPKFPHHKSGLPKSLCVRYQCEGSCRSRCFLSHVVPSKIQGNQRSDIEARFKAAYA